MTNRSTWINPYVGLALLLLAIYLSPYVIFGEDAHVRTHDNLDSNVAWYTVLANSGMLFAGLHETVPNIMNGIPRNSLGSEFNLVILLYFFFKPFTAYALNQVLMRVLAFFGMYLFLKNYLLQERESLPMAAGASLTFAIIPFWPSMGGAIAGIPLALYAFLNIRGGRGSMKDWMILILLPFYTDFVLVFVFFLTCMTVLWVYDWIKTKRIHWPFFIAMAVMTVVYLLVNYRIIYEMFLNPDFVPHRESFDRGHYDFITSVGNWLGNFVVGQTHAIRLTQYIVFPTMIWALIVAKLKHIDFTWMKRIFYLNLLFSFTIGFYYWEGLKGIKARWPIFETFNFGRFHFLEPALWYIGFALALVVIWRVFTWGKPIVYLLLLSQIVILFMHGEELKYRHFDYVSFEQYYSEDLFDQIKTYIGRDPEDYRVVSIGMHPAIAQYNGFYTLDGYVVSYPLSYKKDFRKIIAPELEKNANIRGYYDNWGSRCYIFTDDLGQHYMFTKDTNETLNHLNLNIKQLKNMGGDYILSAVKIGNPDDNRLRLLKVFTKPSSPWKIHLYQVQ
ncbi:DUF6044 family protein [Tuberibacillus sp. Marseille-P3662]|uniref:DUF6044 family protein n=1 Tax=Tuberibacillus sp. Marseille-P3662 TaxID=1965358 RepID=UPI000A1C8394|nr:DUF6044 family protein [Tuberibacillus sp. Marseille-P3662]